MLNPLWYIMIVYNQQQQSALQSKTHNHQENRYYNNVWVLYDNPVLVNQ